MRCVCGIFEKREGAYQIEGVESCETIPQDLGLGLIAEQLFDDAGLRQDLLHFLGTSQMVVDVGRFDGPRALDQ